MAITIEALEKKPSTAAAARILELREMTSARVALGRYGSGQPTRAHLSFQLDHAKAREAVWRTVDRHALLQRLEQGGFSYVEVESQAAERSVYVRRPDLGRILTESSVAKLKQIAAGEKFDIAVVVADGLSSVAIDINVLPLIEALVPKLAALHLNVSPIVVASQARVALGDPIGEALGTNLTVLLVGERPGLSAADSLGVYVTHGPKSGNPDSLRNCISNIREGGLETNEAADVVFNLLRDIMRAGISGVALKAAIKQLGDLSKGRDTGGL